MEENSYNHKYSYLVVHDHDYHESFKSIRWLINIDICIYYNPQEKYTVDPGIYRMFGG